MWYDNSLLLSHNKLINFVIGNRGGGKTFNAKKWAINDFKKRGNTFIWIRRYKSELKKVGRFFDDIKFMFPDDKLEVKGWKCYCNGEVFGEFIALSTSSQEKSVPFPTVNKLIFDEFIIDKGALHYLKNEVSIFLELFETVARMRDNVRALFLGNAISVVNPYFLYWNIKPDLSKRFTVKELIMIELYTDREYVNKKKQTQYGQLIEGTDYGDYSIENVFLRDNDIFIEPKTNKADFMLAIKYNGIHYGFWVDYAEGVIFVNRQYDPSSYNLYAITKEDHGPNMLLIKSLKQCKALERVIFCFQNGLLRFSDMQVKNQFFEFIHYFIR